MKLTSSCMASALIVTTCFLLRGSLESHPVTHILVQIPALAVAGWLIGDAAAARWPALRSSSWNLGGATGILVVFFAGAFWMLPRHIDWAINAPAGELAKFVSIPLAIGLPLALSWHRLSLLVHCLIKTNAISMMLSLAWVYATAPERLCNNYLLGQQQQLGEVLFWLAIVFSIIWSAALFGVRFRPQINFPKPRFA